MNNINDISSIAENQNRVMPQADAIKQEAIADIKNIESLVKAGAMTQEQGQNLMNYVTQKAFERYTSSSAPQQLEQPMQPAQPMQPVPSVKPSLPQNAGEFFNRDGRNDVYEYLKNCNADFDEDEISKISSLVEKIENTAIERYLREQEHEKTVNSENESAKQRLRANAQNAVGDGLNNVVYTREKIGKMSGAEFAKHERAIFDQLRKGLIR